ncbi:MAG: hypothetical protein ACK2UH_12190 [Candidatus Promineifilaceae bacterium]
MNNSEKSVSEIISLVLRAVALAMGMVVVVLSTLGVTEVETSIVLLGIGLFALALDALDRES